VKWAIVLGKGDEVMLGLADWAKCESIRAAQPNVHRSRSCGFIEDSVDQQVECIFFVGDVGMGEGRPTLHVHGCVDKPDGSLGGGHVLRDVASPTLEVFVTEFETLLGKLKDAETELELFELEP
jgi:predicted DNA-binding protein with PD1-like motif